MSLPNDTAKTGSPALQPAEAGPMAPTTAPMIGGIQPL